MVFEDKKIAHQNLVGYLTYILLFIVKLKHPNLFGKLENPEQTITTTITKRLTFSNYLTFNYSLSVEGSLSPSAFS